jgi:hypothetical protein
MAENRSVHPGELRLVCRGFFVASRPGISTICIPPEFTPQSERNVTPRRLVVVEVFSCAGCTIRRLFEELVKGTVAIEAFHLHMTNDGPTI